MQNRVEQSKFVFFSWRQYNIILFKKKCKLIMLVILKLRIIFIIELSIIILSLKQKFN